jgi:CspA family cold shock protein
MALGTVKWFNDAKGYGFISRATDGKDVFVHYSSIHGEGFRTLAQGQTVEYEEQEGPKGLFAARVGKGPA